jgi:hypothetical protein
VTHRLNPSPRSFRPTVKPLSTMQNRLPELAANVVVENLRHQDALQTAAQKESQLYQAAQTLLRDLSEEDIEQFIETTGSEIGAIALESHVVIVNFEEKEVLNRVRVVPDLAYFLAS